MHGNMLWHWTLYRLGLQSARTQTSAAEREVLRGLATGRRRVVEIGVFEGVCSRLLREAMSREGHLWGIDPFPPGRLGIAYGYDIARREAGRLLNGELHFLRQFSYEAVREWREPIDFLFIDADHTYEAVRQDWEQWSPFVVAGGVIALHDSLYVPGRNRPDMGPIRLADEIARERNGFEKIAMVDSLTAFQKRTTGAR